MKCPHCLHLFHPQMDGNVIGTGPEGKWRTSFQTCPGCQKSIIFLSSIDRFGTILSSSIVYPKGTTRTPLSPEVDDIQVRSDYTESCLVLNDSPKSSAALIRRCLQYILRDKASIKNGDLSNEIQQLLDMSTLPSDIAENLDAIRNIGNFATHPMKSTNSGEILDVEPQEAEWNLEVLEQLIDFYYIRPALSQKKRDELNNKLVEAGKPLLK